MPGSPLPVLSKPELFARLALGHAARVCVVTPNQRLSRALQAEFVAYQTASGLKVWEDADVLPWSAFLERCYEDALYSEPQASGGASLPQLLSAAQAEALWREVLEGSGLVALAEAAAECGRAWTLAWQWGIAGALEKFPGSEDSAAFARWARAYARRCEEGGFIDAARLPELGEKILAKRPAALVLYGFDLVTPQIERFVALFPEVLFSHGEKKVPAGIKTSYPNSSKELEAAAHWARARLEEGKSRIGVVVPDLQQRRREVVRVFTRVMQPAAHLPARAAPAMPVPFNVSLGEPLAAYPVVDAALGLLVLSTQEIPWERASRLLRSPFIAGGESEAAARALLDARLRRRLPARVTLGRLVGFLEGSSRSLFEKLFLLKTRSTVQSTHAWAQHFSAVLEAAGFPGERGLDSAEFQAQGRFNEALGELSRLGRVLGEVSAERALAELQRLCADTLFQPESPVVPIQVLGVLESAGLEFDCLWVCGLTESAWPQGARPNPFLPVALQKKAGVPQASADGALAFARGVTEGWLAGAGEVVLSWPEKQDDQDFLPSPLLAGVPEGQVEMPASPAWQELVFASRKTENVPEIPRPLEQTQLRGGVRVLADQAACPFRAFARHRLRAEALEAPSEGLDSRARGNLLHILMAEIWKEVKDRAGLDADLAAVIARAAATAVKEVGVEGRFAELERTRLAKLARDWLALERQRGDFTVVAIEERRPLKAGSLEFSGRIDRMDRLADGSHALIDYKSAKQLTPRMWKGERPDEPQLPLYALAATEDVGAVAYARLRTGGLRYMGYARAKDALPQMTLHDWDSLRREWRASLEGLARGFAAGEARVDPKKGSATCRNCDLQTLCRVNEKTNVLAEGEDE
jgi:ATP-dependent helicase/nuclease subunit B